MSAIFENNITLPGIYFGKNGKDFFRNFNDVAAMGPRILGGTACI